MSNGPTKSYSERPYSVTPWQVRHARWFLPSGALTHQERARRLWAGRGERTERRVEEGNMGELLTTGQAAALLGVSKPTLVRAVQRGQLRPALVTPGQHRRFLREDLLAFRATTLGLPENGLESAGAAVVLPALRAS
jgi:excisionase family DNA binding protein